MLKIGHISSAVAFAGFTMLANAANWEALPTTAPAPSENPTTREKVALGRMLYHDPRLSSTGTVSCASCHNVMGGGEDNRSVSMGVNGQTGGRSAPTVWNSAFSSVQFWDGRAVSLEEQAKGPVTNPIEMGMKSWDDVVKRLKQIPGYQDGFKKAFGSKDAINEDNAARAIAAYERTLITPNSPYDKYVKGNKTALSADQVRGMEKFAEIGCTNCHSGAAFNGPTLETGNGFYMKFPTYPNGVMEAKYRFKTDTGRYEATKKDEDKHMWKVPTLRNIALTAPYFHNGSVKTLDTAVKVMAKTQLDKDLSDGDVADIVAFLNALTGTFPSQPMPRLPETAGTTFN